MEFDDEWELLSDDDGGFLQISDDGTAAANQIYSRNSVFHTNYFICPSPPQFVETTAAPDRDQHQHQHQPIQINIDCFSAGGGADRDPISQVLFKKMKEAEFVDIKVESPKFEGNYQFEEKADPRTKMRIENEKEVGMGYDDLEEDGANVWKWRLSGIGGAICSFGVAAATFCIIVFTKHPHHNHKLHFRIYTDDHDHDHDHDHQKRLKVKGGAIAAVSGGVPININRARITVGGYYAPPL